MKYLNSRNFIVLPAWIINMDNISTDEKLILATIYGFTQAGNPCIVTNEYLQSICCKSKSTICRALKNLKNTGIIEVEIRETEAGGNHANEYKFSKEYTTALPRY